MNSETEKVPIMVSTNGKIIHLYNSYSQIRISILIKSAGGKIAATKLEGKMDVISSITKSLEHISWEEGKTFFKEQLIPYPYHLQLTYIQSLEKIMGLSSVVPERALFLRTIALEFERIISHLELLKELVKSFSYQILYTKIAHLKNKIEGTFRERISMNNDPTIFTVGGVSNDFYDSSVQGIINLIPIYKKQVIAIRQNITRNRIFRELLKDTGFLSREIVKKLGLVGPIARSSGISDDVRKTDSYAAYSKVYFSTPVYDTCDLYGEVMVRLDEVLESFKIIHQLIKELPQGEIMQEPPNTKIPASNTIMRLETPSGELFCYSMSNNGTLNDLPKLFRVTSPMKLNSQGILARLAGERLENLSHILAMIGGGWRSY